MIDARHGEDVEDDVGAGDEEHREEVEEEAGETVRDPARALHTQMSLSSIWTDLPLHNRWSGSG